MGQFTWKDEYSIGNAVIDAEHRHLIALASTVAGFANSGERVERVKEAVVALYDYVKTHFQHEEEYMAGIDFPGLAEHRRQHQEIIHEMNTIMKHSGNLDALIYKFKRLMHVWVLEHIIEDDHKITQASKWEENSADDAP